MKTAKINLKIMTLLAAICFLTSCEKDEFLDQGNVLTGDQTEMPEGIIMENEALELAIPFSLDAEVKVQYSDDEKVVLVIHATGTDELGREVTLSESRIINLSDRSMTGEGRLSIENIGNIYFTSQATQVPLPNEEMSMNYSYLIDIYSSDISELEFPDVLKYEVTRNDQATFSEKILIIE